MLLQSLSTESLDATEKQVQSTLASWDDRMEVDSSAASVWWVFWQEYLSATFDPWWKSHRVNIDRNDGGNSNPLNDALGQDLEAWTLHDQTNPAFTLIGSAQNASDVMRQSFHLTVKALEARLGPDPARWGWGRLHQRTIENLAQITGLDYGPHPDRGDKFTPLAAPDFP